MDGAGGQHPGRGAEAVQRAAPCARQHFATDADLDAEISRARRPGDAHGLPDHSATRRLRADKARTFLARTSEQPRSMGPAKSLGHSRCTAAIRWRSETPRRLTGNPSDAPKAPGRLGASGQTATIRGFDAPARAASFGAGPTSC